MWHCSKCQNEWPEKGGVHQKEQCPFCDSMKSFRVAREGKESVKLPLDWHCKWCGLIPLPSESVHRCQSCGGPLVRSSDD